MNQMRTTILLAALTGVLVWAGGALGGESGMVVALGLAAIMNIGAYWWSDRLVLRMHGAQPLTEGEAPELYAMVRRLAQAAQLPMPKVFLIPEAAPNAFATGRNPQHGVVAVTQGLLQLLDRHELAGVIAHELGHIKQRDTLVMTVAATLAGAVSMLANMAQWSLLFGGRSADAEEEGSHPVAAILGILVAPVAAALIQMAISRSREFLADAAGARISHEPQALARALKKITAWSQQVALPTATPATAHLFIVNPLTGGGLLKLFSTHPPVEERVARLLAMDRARGPLAWAAEG
jgi:heat shock protein HtpX